MCTTGIPNSVYKSDAFIFQKSSSDVFWDNISIYDIQLYCCWPCLPRQGYCVFRFIIEYISSLMDFVPWVVGLFLYEDF